MSNNLRVNVLNGFNYQMPQFQFSSAYTKGVMVKNVKNGSTYPVLHYCSRDFWSCICESPGCGLSDIVETVRNLRDRDLAQTWRPRLCHKSRDRDLKFETETRDIKFLCW